MQNLTSSLNKLCTAEKHTVHSAFSPKMLTTIRKCVVTKTPLSVAVRFWRQRSAMLHTFGENLDIWVSLKKIYENVGYTVFGIY